MNMIQVLKRIANTSVNTFPLAIMSIRPLFEEIWTGNAICRTNVVPRQERVKGNSFFLPVGRSVTLVNAGIIIWAGLFKKQPNLAIFSDILVIF
jgi:hypothetical protein